MRIRRARSGMLSFLGIAVLLGLVACGTTKSVRVPIPTATPSGIQIVVEQKRISTSQPIGVTVANNTPTNFYALDGHSACSMIQLQQYDVTHRTWINVDGCATLHTPHAYLLSPGIQEPFTLAPTSAQDANAWQAGVYRIALAYSPQPDGRTGMQVTYSAGFTVTTATS